VLIAGTATALPSAISDRDGNRHLAAVSTTSGNDRALWSLFTLTTTGSRPRPIAKEDQIPVSKTDDKPTPRFTRGQLAQLGEVS
jgi:hypothetical protein